MKLKIGNIRELWAKTPWQLRSLASMAVTLAFVVVAFLLGYAIRGCGQAPAPQPHDGVAQGTQDEVKVWTCSMHPNVRQPKPGKCPICFMDLIPASGGGTDEGERKLVVSRAAAALAEIRTSPAERKLVDIEVRMVGRIDYDETRLATITAWASGRLDRLYVDYTGVPVRKGEHLVTLYSPDLYAAQAELVQALKIVEDMKGSDLPDLRRTAQDTVEAVREKLRLLGLKPEQIAEAERTKKPSDHVTIYAPIGGIVIHKNAVEGMYVQTGTRIYTVADLSRVWVKLDAYESDLPWVRYGQDVEFTTEAHPGETFMGTVTFVAPMLDARTRTVKVRLNADNRQGRLKPGMFVRAVLRATVTEDGRALEPRLAGKWICSMHPEVLKDEPGKCDICEMPLVTTESLGYAPKPGETQPPLVIPASAPLITGSRAIVYVQVPGTRKPTFEGRDIVLGPRAGDHYVVRKGLKEGELVVTHGAFKLDSELQLQGKPSMMGAPPAAHHHGQRTPRQTTPAPAQPAPDVPEAFRRQLTRVLDAYLAIWRALAADDPKAAAAAGKQLDAALAAVDMKLLDGDGHVAWMKHLNALGKASKQLAAAKDIRRQREGFDLLSQALTPTLKRFGHASDKPITRFHCPMAFNNRGADWLQDSDDLRNPYFGAAMLKCGEAVGRVEGRGSRVEGKAKTQTEGEER